MGDPDTFDSKKLEKALADNNVELACINPVRITTQFGLSLLHPDENIRKRAFAKLQSVTEIAGRFKCPVSIGLIRGGAFEGKPISYTRDIFVQIMQEACDNALNNTPLYLIPQNRDKECLRSIGRCDKYRCFNHGWFAQRSIFGGGEFKISG